MAEQESDQQTEVLNALRAAQTENIKNVNDFMRQSIQSQAASERRSLNESLILDAVASHIEALQR